MRITDRGVHQSFRRVQYFLGVFFFWVCFIFLPPSPLPGPFSAGPLFAGPPSTGPPKISLFFPSPATIFCFPNVEEDISLRPSSSHPCNHFTCNSKILLAAERGYSVVKMEDLVATRIPCDLVFLKDFTIPTMSQNEEHFGDLPSKMKRK